MSLGRLSRSGFVKSNAVDAKCQNALGQPSAPPSVHYVIIGTRLHLCVPQFPPLENGGNNGTYPPGWL